ncbi:MAG: Chromate transport protein ChrA, partial [Labilithrix sp.]|nr:Chromate transport protein ChrA [Labilithrix sp.]
SLRSSRQKPPSASLLFGALPVVSGAATPSLSSAGILVVFLKIGSVLFGSGYVLLAFLRSELVEQRHWLTEAQLLDAVAVGQITPGPVFSTATFVGYLLHGVSGAIAATVGIFLPAFFFVAVSAPFLSRLRQSPSAGRFLDGVNVASLALMALVLLDLGQAAVVDAWTLGFAIAGGVLLLRYKVNAAWLVIAGGLLGVLVR